MLVLTGVLIGFRVSLRLAFLAAEPALSEIVEREGVAGFDGLDADVRAGVYTISGDWTTERLLWWDEGEERDMVVFILADPWESGFIYSETGIDDLRYNSGNKGWLFGDWYWMTED